MPCLEWLCGGGLAKKGNQLSMCRQIFHVHLSWNAASCQVLGVGQACRRLWQLARSAADRAAGEPRHAARAHQRRRRSGGSRLRVKRGLQARLQLLRLALQAAAARALDGDGLLGARYARFGLAVRALLAR
jgi:hypothetical protein